MVHKPNPVQSISQQRQQFALRQQPPIQMPMGQPNQEHEPQQDLAEEIYVRLVDAEYRDGGYSALDQSRLRQLARDARAAAAAYFEEETNG